MGEEGNVSLCIGVCSPEGGGEVCECEEGVRRGEGGMNILSPLASSRNGCLDDGVCVSE